MRTQAEIRGRILDLILELCAELDYMIYLPVKYELEGIDCQHSLGARKEDFKHLIDDKLREFGDWIFGRK